MKWSLTSFSFGKLFKSRILTAPLQFPQLTTLATSPEVNKANWKGFSKAWILLKNILFFSWHFLINDSMEFGQGSWIKHYKIAVVAMESDCPSVLHKLLLELSYGALLLIAHSSINYSLSSVFPITFWSCWLILFPLPLRAVNSISVLLAKSNENLPHILLASHVQNVKSVPHVCEAVNKKNNFRSFSGT